MGEADVPVGQKPGGDSQSTAALTQTCSADLKVLDQLVIHWFVDPVVDVKGP